MRAEKRNALRFWCENGKERDNWEENTYVGG
jgi:hypothetical protein